MSGPASAVDMGMETVQYALKFGDDCGKSIFRAWLASLPSVDLVRLREVCEKLALGAKADKFAKISLFDVRLAYNAAGPARAVVERVASPPCAHCGTVGFVFVVFAGENAGTARVVARHHVAPWAYRVASLVPCVCDRGGVQRDKTRPGSDAGWSFKSWSKGRVESKWAECVFPDGRAADRFVYDCIALRKKEAGVTLTANDAGGVEFPADSSAGVRRLVERFATVGG